MTDQGADCTAIIDLAASYAQAVDAGDFERLRSLFTPDATAELGGSGQVGIDAICDRLSSALSPFVSWEHHIDGHEVVVDGDVATATCSVHATHVRPPGEIPAVYSVTGTYEDRLVRTGDGWRIAHRALLVTDRDGSRRAGS